MVVGAVRERAARRRNDAKGDLTCKSLEESDAVDTLIDLALRPSRHPPESKKRARWSSEAQFRGRWRAIERSGHATLGFSRHGSLEEEEC